MRITAQNILIFILFAICAAIIGVLFIPEAHAYDDEESAEVYISCIEKLALKEDIDPRAAMMSCHDEAHAWMHYDCEAHGYSEQSCGMQAYIFAIKILEHMEKNGMVSRLHQ